MFQHVWSPYVFRVMYEWMRRIKAVYPVWCLATLPDGIEMSNV